MAVELLPASPVSLDIPQSPVNPERPVTIWQGRRRPIVVLGGGFAPDHPVVPPGDPTAHQRQVQTLRAIAAGHAFTHQTEFGHADVIVPTGGKSAGDGWPAESSVMKQTILKTYPTIPETVFIEEDKSIDTQENLKFFKKIQQERNLDEPVVVTNKFYEPWTKRLLKKEKIKARILDAEKIVGGISTDMKQLVEKFRTSEEYKFWKKRSRILNLLPINLPIIGDVLLKLLHRRAQKELAAGGR